MVFVLNDDSSQTFISWLHNLLFSSIHLDPHIANGHPQSQDINLFANY